MFDCFLIACLSARSVSRDGESLITPKHLLNFPMMSLIVLSQSASAFTLMGLRGAQTPQGTFFTVMSAKDLGGGIDKETHELWRPGEAVDPARNLLQLLDLWDEEEDGAAEECSISDSGESAGCCMIGPEVSTRAFCAPRHEFRSCVSRLLFPSAAATCLAAGALDLMRLARFSFSWRSPSRPCATAWTWLPRRRSWQKSSRWSSSSRKISTTLVQRCPLRASPSRRCAPQFGTRSPSASKRAPPTTSKKLATSGACHVFLDLRRACCPCLSSRRWSQGRSGRVGLAHGGRAPVEKNARRRSKRRWMNGSAGIMIRKKRKGYVGDTPMWRRDASAADWIRSTARPSTPKSRVQRERRAERAFLNRFECESHRQMLRRGWCARLIPLTPETADALVSWSRRRRPVCTYSMIQSSSQSKVAGTLLVGLGGTLGDFAVRVRSLSLCLFMVTVCPSSSLACNVHVSCCAISPELAGTSSLVALRARRCSSRHLEAREREAPGHFRAC